ncbi:ABC transporter substrate-binding protein [Gammaproteobacteria bacterium]|nr:ABC transporter substrate-binding protein [Gammaproteobacteria bacterium]
MRRPNGLLIALVFAPLIAAENTLTVVSWGGAYEAAQQRALFTPFEQGNDWRIAVVKSDGSVGALQARAPAEQWDVVDMSDAQALKACEAGLLYQLNAEDILIPDRSIALEDDFVENAINDCSIASNVFAEVFAYDNRAFPGQKPLKVDDFFDVENFPGKRAVPRRPDGLLEWALLADGVPVQQVYDLLSTERGLDLAFSRLDDLREHLLWFDDPADASALLQSGDATIAIGFNGRFFAAEVEEDAPITIVWDGQLIAYSTWVIPLGSRHLEQAQEFIGFATSSDAQARLAEHIPYTPTRQSGLDRVGRHYRKPIPMRDHLPNNPLREDRVLLRDSAWYAHTETLRQQRFDAWLEGS